MIGGDEAIGIVRPARLMRRGRSAAARIPFILLASPVIAAVTINFLLCLLNTRFLEIRPLHVMAGEVAIIAAALYLGRAALDEKTLVGMTLLFGYLVALWLLTQQPDPKIWRDLLIPFAFFALGAALARPEDGDRLVLILILVVLAVALVEFLATESFLQWFDIRAYYLARGTLSEADVEAYDSSLFISGLRPSGHGWRSLLPFLGDQRVSSVFLEPVSHGNFAAIAAAWLACRFHVDPRRHVVLILLCVMLMVLADARFAAVSLLLVLLSLATRAAESRLFTLLYPLLAIAVLIAVALLFVGLDPENDFLGRLYMSGDIVSSLGLAQVLGLERSTFPTADSGYAYLITNAGIGGAMLAWCLFAFMKTPNRTAARVRGVVALFAALSLCVSGNSLFSIKVAGLLWFLYGAAQNADPRRNI
jgi:putative polymerase